MCANDIIENDKEVQQMRIPGILNIGVHTTRSTENESELDR